LLKYGPDIEARERNHNTALMVASSRGCFATVKVLMSGKVKPNTAASRPDGATPLVLACHSGHTNIVRYFLSLPEGLKPDVNFSPPVHNKPNAPSPLNVAAKEGRTEIVRMLLAEKPTPRSDFVDSLGQSAICSAAVAGHTEVRFFSVL
jgi:ankyrin repeat protein